MTWTIRMTGGAAGRFDNRTGGVQSGAFSVCPASLWTTRSGRHRGGGRRCGPPREAAHVGVCGLSSRDRLSRSAWVGVETLDPFCLLIVLSPRGALANPVTGWPPEQWRTGLRLWNGSLRSRGVSWPDALRSQRARLRSRERLRRLLGVKRGTASLRTMRRARRARQARVVRTSRSALGDGSPGCACRSPHGQSAA